MVTRRLAVNPVPCTGCLNCAVVCGQARAGSHDPEASVFRVELDPFLGIHRHIYCRQCSDPGCARVCPSGAIGRSADTGAWVLDLELCVRCRKCVAACPFGAMSWRADVDLPVKCDLCGGFPRCAQACSFGVIRFLEPSDPLFAARGMPQEEQDPLLGRGS